MRDWDAATSARPEQVAALLPRRDLGEPVRDGHRRRSATGRGHLLSRRGRVPRPAPAGRGPVRGLAAETTWPGVTSPSTRSPGCRLDLDAGRGRLVDPSAAERDLEDGSCARSATPASGSPRTPSGSSGRAGWPRARAADRSGHGGGDRRARAGTRRPSRASASATSCRASCGLDRSTVARRAPARAARAARASSCPSSPRCAASRRRRPIPGDALDHTLRTVDAAPSDGSGPAAGRPAPRPRQGDDAARRPLHRPRGASVPSSRRRPSCAGCACRERDRARSSASFGTTCTTTSRGWTDAAVRRFVRRLSTESIASSSSRCGVPTTRRPASGRRGEREPGRARGADRAEQLSARAGTARRSPAGDRRPRPPARAGHRRRAGRSARSSIASPRSCSTTRAATSETSLLDACPRAVTGRTADPPPIPDAEGRRRKDAATIGGPDRCPDSFIIVRHRPEGSCSDDRQRASGPAARAPGDPAQRVARRSRCRHGPGHRARARVADGQPLAGQGREADARPHARHARNGHRLSAWQRSC